MIEEKIKQAIELLREAIEDDLRFEDHNFRVDSKGWMKITVDGEKYLVNPENDIWEIFKGEYKGEQLFTWDAAIRETTKAGKRMPTNDEFTELLKTKEDMPNLILAGFRYTNGPFANRGTRAFFWSSTESGANAWFRSLYSLFATVYRSTAGKADGFSVRCLDKQLNIKK